MSCVARWSVLGAGTILPRLGYGPAGYALRPAAGAPVTLFDCGPGTLRKLPELGIELADVERVVLSHYHLDHCLDLFALAFALRNPSLPRRGPLEVIGPSGLHRLLSKAVGALGKWGELDGVTLLEVPLEPGPMQAAGLARGALDLRWTSVEHTPEAVAWSCAVRGVGRVVYSGDSGPCQALGELARGADLFVCECSHADQNAQAGHLTPSAAGQLAREAQVGRLVLTHFYTPLEPEAARARAAEQFDGPIECARDGAEFEFGLSGAKAP